jgi:non-specific serine/threonine protein kinase
LWATLDWSFRLLKPLEQRIFTRLSVYAGGCDLTAAQRVCTSGIGHGTDIGASDVLDLLGELVDKSLVLSSEDNGQTRFQLLEPVRQFAQQQLEAAGEAAGVRARHAAYFLSLAELAQAELLKADQADWYERIELELDNMRAVLEWSRTAADRLETGLRMVGALWRFWDGRGHLREGRTWVGQLLAQAQPVPSVGKGRALFAAGWLAALQDTEEAGLPFAEQSVAVWRQLDEWRGLAWALWLSGMVRRNSDPEAGLRAAEEGLELAQRHEDRTLGNWMLWLLGELHRKCGDEAGAVELFDRVALGRELGDSIGTSYVLRSLGQLAGRRGDYAAAADYLRERLTLSRRVEDQWALADSLEGLAWLAGAQRQAERAAHLYGAAEAVRLTHDLVLSGERRARRERRAHIAAAALGDASSRFTAAWTAGRAMTLDQAIAYAFEEPESDAANSATTGAYPTSTVAAVGGLTGREREVAGLVGLGLSTRQIAARLVITEGTAKVHVAHILNKLELHSRAQLAVWAVQQGLLAAPEVSVGKAASPGPPGGVCRW